jgi:tetratricopeptide (TPR) repeat protein
MFRHVVVSAFIALCTIGSVSQEIGDKCTGPALNNANQPARTGKHAPTRGAADGHISITRLREPRKVRRLYKLAMEAWSKHKPAEAARRLEQALNLYPPFPEALTFYGGIQGSVQQWESAERSLQAAIESDPSYSPAFAVLAGVYNDQKRFDDAQVAAQQAISVGDDSWDVQYEMARALIGKKQYETALAISDAALRSTPHGSLMHLAKAHALLGLGEYPQAVTELRTYLRYQPDGEGSERARDLLNQIPGAE